MTPRLSQRYIYTVCVVKSNQVPNKALIHLVVISYVSFSILSPLCPFFTFVIIFYISFMLDAFLRYFSSLTILTYVVQGHEKIK